MNCTANWAKPRGFSDNEHNPDLAILFTLLHRCRNDNIAIYNYTVCVCSPTIKSFYKELTLHRTFNRKGDEFYLLYKIHTN